MARKRGGLQLVPTHLTVMTSHKIANFFLLETDIKYLTLQILFFSSIPYALNAFEQALLRLLIMM
jgi:hypothetical protein